MPLNIVPAIAAARRPRGMVKLNGEAVPGWIEWEVENNACYQADTWRLKLACAGLPASKRAPWISRQADLTVELLGGFPADPDHYTAAELTSFVIGRVDQLDYDPAENTIELYGRDYTSQFIDSKTTEKWQNRTSSQIAQALAARHGMTCETMATKTRAGTYYQIDHAQLSDERTEWDVLTWLAHEEQYDVWVTGTTLHFMPKVDPTKAEKFKILWQPPATQGGYAQCNVETLKFSRNLTIAKDVKVTVKSWNAKQKKAFSVTVQAVHNKSKTLRNTKLRYGQAQEYSYTIPGLTKEAALRKAQALLNDISRHEMRLAATGPGDTILGTRTLIEVTGTGTGFDQTYWPEAITRRMSFMDGFKVDLRAKNHSPESTVSI